MSDPKYITIDNDGGNPTFHNSLDDVLKFTMSEESRYGVAHVAKIVRLALIDCDDDGTLPTVSKTGSGMVGGRNINAPKPIPESTLFLVAGIEKTLESFRYGIIPSEAQDRLRKILDEYYARAW